MTGNSRFLEVRKALLDLSHHLGKADNRLVILGEGNTSASVDEEVFLVKASGTELRALKENELVRVRFDRILPMLDQDLNQQETLQFLLDARVDPEDLRPSVETAFHAWLLKQEGVDFVGHTHPDDINKILCSERAEDFAENRLFPDEVVCCGPKSLLIGYVDPGTLLAAAIRKGWEGFVADHGFGPRLILVRNHGLLAVGSSPGVALTATLMAVKAAGIFLGACALGEPVFMDPREVSRIHERMDEHYRQKRLNL